MGICCYVHWVPVNSNGDFTKLLFAYPAYIKNLPGYHVHPMVSRQVFYAHGTAKYMLPRRGQ